MKSKIKRILIIITFIFSVISWGCNEDKCADYKPCSQRIKNKDTVSIKKTKIYLETSASIKGYVETEKKSNFKDIKYITKLEKISDTIELYTIKDEPVLYKESFNEFNNNLINGKIFNDGRSRLHQSITFIVDSLKNNEVAVFISDLIPDIRERNKGNISNLDIIQNEIFDLISKKKNISIIVYQFHTNFNAKNYFNANGNEKPFLYEKEIKTLENRPYYICFFGESEVLKKILENNIMANYTNVFSYGLQYNCNDVNSKFIALSGSQIIYEEVVDRIGGNDVEFAISLNLEKIPNYAITNEYLKENLHLEPLHVKSDMEILTMVDFRKKHPSKFKEEKNTNLVVLIKLKPNKETEDYSLISSVPKVL